MTLSDLLIYHHSSKTLVNSYQITWHHIWEDST